MLTTQIQTKKIQADFTFSAKEKNQLTILLQSVKGHPFYDYSKFLRSVQTLIKNNTLPTDFLAYIEKAKKRSLLKKPYVFLSNCPIDEKLPLLDWEDPRTSKLQLKKTFIAEAFLILYAELMNTPTLAYRFGGNGDYIRDVHPKKALQKSQTSLTLTSFGFHKELPIRNTSPDFLRIMGLRNSKANEILTTFIRNIDIINVLDGKTIDILRTKQFRTPFTVLSVNKDKNEELGQAPMEHAILENYEISYHEGRTIGLTEKAQAAILKLNNALKQNKKGVLLDNGDFVDLANKYCLHAKDVNFVKDEEALKQRWLIKTFNARNIKTFEPFFVEGKYGMVNG